MRLDWISAHYLGVCICCVVRHVTVQVRTAKIILIFETILQDWSKDTVSQRQQKNAARLLSCRRLAATSLTVVLKTLSTPRMSCRYEL